MLLPWGRALEEQAANRGKKASVKSFSEVGEHTKQVSLDEWLILRGGQRKCKVSTEQLVVTEAKSSYNNKHVKGTQAPDRKNPSDHKGNN